MAVQNRYNLVEGERPSEPGVLDYCAENRLGFVPWSPLARQWGCGLAELALAYTLALPGVAAVIPSASRREQLETNARAGTLALSAEQRQQIAAVLRG